MHDMDISVNACQPDDLKGVLNVLAQAMSADPISEAKFVRQVLLDHNFRADGAIVAKCNGEVAGFCLSLARHVPLENAAGDADRGYITLFGVAPKFQRKGVVNTVRFDVPVTELR